MKYIGLEACCLFEFENIEDMDCNIGEAYCMNETENREEIGARCFDIDQKRYCPNLMFGTAAASLIVTDSNGDAVNGTCFMGNGDWTDEQWETEPEIWFKKQQEYFESIRE